MKLIYLKSSIYFSPYFFQDETIKALGDKLLNQEESYSNEISGLKSGLRERDNVVNEKEEIIKISNEKNEALVEKINQLEDQEKDLREMLGSSVETLKNKVIEINNY